MEHLRRRELLVRAGGLGLAAVIADALPLARALGQVPVPAVVDVDGTLQAFADTMIPGRRADRTETGGPIHPRAIAGVDPLPGAVETDALALYRHEKVGFDALAPAFLTDVLARSDGRPFLELGFDERAEICRSGLDFGNPSRTVWEAAAAVPFTAFCAAATQRNATSRTASGYRVMGLPGRSGGYPRRRYSYVRKFARERTKRGYLA